MDKIYTGAFVKNDGISLRVITGSHDKQIRIWDMETGKCLRNCLSYSQCYDLEVCQNPFQSNLMVSGHYDSTVKLWDLRTYSIFKKIDTAHNQLITSVSLSMGE